MQQSTKGKAMIVPTKDEVALTKSHMALSAKNARKWYKNLETGKVEKRDIRIACALFHSEASEALEADRKSLMDDKLPQYPGLAVEMADLVIRILDTAHNAGLPVERFAVYDKTPKINDSTAVAIFDIHKLISKVGTSRNPMRTAAIMGSIIGVCSALIKRSGHDPHKIIRAKNRFNASRKDHKMVERKKANGKKY